MPTDEMFVIPEDAPTADFGIRASQAESTCMVDESHTLLCAVNHAQWAKACGQGRSGAITMNAGTPDLACVEGDLGAMGSALDEAEIGSTILLDGGAIACAPQLGMMSCWDTASHHGFVVNNQEYRFF